MLKIPLISRYLDRRGRRRLRCIMRGYRRLKEANRLGEIGAVRDVLTNTPLGIDMRGVSTLIFGAGVRNAELSARQYVLTRAVGGVALNRSILHSVGMPGSGLVHHLPPEWRKVLRELGFKVGGFRSAVAWNGFVALFFVYGLWSIGKGTVSCIRELVRPSTPELGRFAFFEGLSAGNLPQLGQDGQSHDIVTWYQQWSARDLDLDSFCHSVKDIAPSAVNGVPVLCIASAVPALNRFGQIVRYLGWGVAASAVAFIDLLRGRWWHPIFLSQASLAATVRYHDSHALARDYLFHNGDWVYRPLWTYEAERQGSRVTFYFYSTNCEEFKRPEGYPVQSHSYQSMSWPHYLVWDDYQASFVRRAVGESANISVVGPIWFHTSATEIPAFPLGCVAVFDVQPMRASRYQVLGAPWEYFTPETSSRFLLDIHAVIKDFGGKMVLKRKRHIGRLLHARYRVLMEALLNQDEIEVVDPDLSALGVIDRCAAVISMPFTSTALLGRELGKPTIYYDPFGVIQKDDRAAHGIQVVSGVAELKEWFTTNERLLHGVPSSLGSSFNVDA